jgi:predicted dienelactone hydrolase
MGKQTPTKIDGWIRPLTLAILSTLITTIPGRAAERIYLTYGPINWSIKVDSLASFAKEGTVNKDLEFYLNLLETNTEQQAKFREILLKRAEVNPVVLSRFLNTEIGEDILARIGKGITIQGGRNGQYALRAAIVQAAFDSQEGLTLLNVLRKLPTNMQLQGELILEFAAAIDKVVKATYTFTEAMATISAQEAARETSVNFAQLVDPRQPGKLGFQKETFTLKDTSRNRQFYLILYQPQQWLEGKTPVVIISHGLASRPEDFENLAQHLASYGYVVALPQHPGSDYQQAKALLEGYSREVFARNEFINRPKDISYVIDELQRRNAEEFQGRLDLENVGVWGHSFGGYTALAVAGAEIDWQHLQEDCFSQFGALNTSLLLQCRALGLPHKNYNFRDSRVKAVAAINPVNSSIFGAKGLGKIQIPVILGAGNYDPATPAVFEQLRSFIWLKTANKYLILSEGQAHVDFSQLDASVTEVIDSVGKLTLPSPDLLLSIRKSLSLVFFEVYISKNSQFSPYLSSSYGAYLTKNQAFKLYLISAASEPALQQVIDDFVAREGTLKH